MTETDVSALIRIEAARCGLFLMRNNSGAFQQAAGGRWVRFGLGNDSAEINAVVKSSDLIGFLASGAWWGWPSAVGVFTAVESKHPGWRYTGTDRERAQLAFIDHVRRHGGVACFATCFGDVNDEIQRYFQARQSAACFPPR